jgi:hypothetical protein
MTSRIAISWFTATSPAINTPWVSTMKFCCRTSRRHKISCIADCSSSRRPGRNNEIPFPRMKSINRKKLRFATLQCSFQNKNVYRWYVITFQESGKTDSSQTMYLSESKRKKKYNLKFRVFCDVAPCSHVEVNRRFRGEYCLHHQGDHRDYKALHPRKL